MCVCVYIYIYTHTRIYIYIYIYIHIHTRTYQYIIQIHEYIHTHVFHIYIHTWHICTYMYITHAYTHILKSAPDKLEDCISPAFRFLKKPPQYTHVYIHTYIHKCIIIVFVCYLPAISKILSLPAFCFPGKNATTNPSSLQPSIVLCAKPRQTPAQSSDVSSSSILSFRRSFSARSSVWVWVSLYALQAVMPYAWHVRKCGGNGMIMSSLDPRESARIRLCMFVCMACMHNNIAYADVRVYGF
jgi:hypothetical protein